MNSPSLTILKLRSDSSQKEKRKEKKPVGTNVKGSDNLCYADHKGCHWPWNR